MPEYSFETVTIDERGQETARESHSARYFAEPLADRIVLEMTSIPGGIYPMGSFGREGYDDERPQHSVAVHAFWIGKYEITQEQWLAVMKKQLPCRFQGFQKPIDRASWKDSVEFCKRLAKMTGRAYRLPSEAEWEFACRAGTATPFYFGKTITTGLANYVGEHLFAQEPKGIYRHTTTEVGSFPPNAFGLYDMHGNLWEWCADAWHEDYTGAPVDGSAWLSKDERGRVVRGGSWHETPGHCRSAVRLKADPSERDDFIGFRIALSGTLPKE
jgi:formylglycine-generating enzyme required for sulfatase activity